MQIHLWLTVILHSTTQKTNNELAKAPKREQYDTVALNSFIVKPGKMNKIKLSIRKQLDSDSHSITACCELFVSNMHV